MYCVYKWNLKQYVSPSEILVILDDLGFALSCSVWTSSTSPGEAACWFPAFSMSFSFCKKEESLSIILQFKRCFLWELEKNKEKKCWPKVIEKAEKPFWPEDEHRIFHNFLFLERLLFLSVFSGKFLFILHWSKVLSKHPLYFSLANYKSVFKVRSLLTVGPSFPMRTCSQTHPKSGHGNKNSIQMFFLNSSLPQENQSSLSYRWNQTDCIFMLNMCS